MREITSSEFDKEVLAGGKVVVDFYSTECPPCEALAPKFDGLSDLYGKDIKFVKMFRQQNKALAEQLGVKSSPTLLFFDNGAQVGGMLAGGIKRSDIIHRLDAMLPAQRVTEIKAHLKPTVSEFDVIILGAGPGGLTAGLYLCQAKINTVLVDVALPGGHVSTTHEVSNYPGFIEPQAGYMLSHNMSEQTKQCGTTYKVAVDVTKIDLEKKEVVIDEFETIRAKKIIIATGTSPNLMGVPGEKELKGKGISYCATCDAKYYGDKEVVVIGGGNSAVEEADFISKFAGNITMVHQFGAFTANKQAQAKLLANPKVATLFEHEPRSFVRHGDKIITEVEDLKTKKVSKLVADGVFVFIGMKPNIELFKDKLALDSWGYIKTDEDMRTSMPGVFAVGDVISKKYRQITTAVADGTIAAIAIAKELN
ncbi:FAD-dependent oxidoreductase [Williamwhitmania taraxaci]|uniref:Thioredoxin reductase (NADPH) n=1 Tax=Williamwhitmania taraxaci TaxID=1640674 RepID=A0A1G6HEH8_9BACT|nr:FAD-dependent oxidoreductase [Williamwhitmania taraxaci]SDB92717.1 thioredoxin reductase (NADPH) [Williamwhitmania taraxaci]